MKAKKPTKTKTRNSPKKKPTKTEPVVIDPGRRYKTLEYIEFVKWSSLPSSERDPKTQGEFATKFKMTGDTLSEWKQDDNFWVDVSRVRKAYMKDDFAAVVRGLRERCIKEGRGQDVKVYAQLAGEMKEDNEFGLSPALEAALVKIHKRLPD